MEHAPMNDSAAHETLPIWFPEKGKAFIAAVIEVDPPTGGSSAEYILVAAHDVVCRRGEAEGEEVTIAAGGRFKMRWHHFLPLADYAGLGSIGIASVRQSKTDRGETVWEWNVRTTPAQKARLASAREPPIPF